MIWMRLVTLFLTTAIVLSCAAAPGSGLERGTRPEAPSAEVLNAYIKATILQREGRFDEALEVYEDIIEEGEASEALGERVIRNYLRLQEYQKARDASRQLLEQYPSNARLWLFLGLAHDRLDQPQEAAEAFRNASRLSPEDQLLQQALAEAQERSNDLVALTESYERLVDMEPDSANLRRQFAFALMRIGDNMAAAEQFQKAIELGGGDPRSRFLLALIYLDEGENEASLREFEALLAEDPAFPDAGPYVAAAMARLEQYGRAFSVLRALIENGEAETGHYLQAMYLLWKAGRAGEAAAFVPAENAPIFGQLLRAFLLKAEGKPYRALLDTLDGVDGDMHREADSYIREMLYLEGADTEGGAWLAELEALRTDGAAGKRFNTILARTYMFVEQAAKARPLLEEVLTKHGDDQEIHYYLAIIAEEQDDIVAAERHLKAILKADPADHNTMNFLGYMYAEKGIKLDEAYRLLEQALELDPNNPFYLDSLGWVYYKQGDADRAIQLIRRAILGMENDDAELRDHLGDAYALKGEWAKAIGQWERALRLDREREGIADKIERARQRINSR